MNILICGDMNERCGNLLDYIENEENYIQLDNMSMNETDNLHVERRCKDKVVNNYGKQLVTLFINFNIHILNGRKCCDEQGEHTCITSSGKSYVDYMICFRKRYNRIKKVYVSFEDVTQFRIDHLPI